MRRGLLTWQLADAMNISRKRMNDIEKGRTVATEAEVLAISEYLRFPIAWFFRPHVDIPTLEQIN
jgi:transcriptional regulator with XRE-family HTH domain